MMPKVHIVRGKDAYKNTTMILKKAGKEFINNLRSPLIIKPNLVVDKKNECATTNPQTVKAIVDYIISNASIDNIIIADGSGDDTKVAFDRFGYNSLFESMDVELRDLNKDKVSWIDISDPITGRPRKLPIAESVLSARYLISVAIPKTHDHGIVTLGLKNLVGIIPGSKWKKSIHGNRYPDELSDWELEQSINGFHRNIFALNKKVRIDFTVIDGVCSMEGDGPVNGKIRKTNFGLGGADPVAVDAVTAFLMGFDPYEIGYLYLCEKAGLGIADLSKIQIEPGGGLKLRKKFKPHRRYSHMHYTP